MRMIPDHDQMEINGGLNAGRRLIEVSGLVLAVTQRKVPGHVDIGRQEEAVRRQKPIVYEVRCRRTAWLTSAQTLAKSWIDEEVAE